MFLIYFGRPRFRHKNKLYNISDCWFRDIPNIVFKGSWTSFFTTFFVWLSVHLQTKWLWVRIPLLSPKLQIWILLWARSSLTFRQTIECRFTVKLEHDMIITNSHLTFLMLYFINWPHFVVWLTLLFEILGNMCIVIDWCPVYNVINFESNHSFLIKLFFYVTKKLEQQRTYLKNGQSF